MSKWSSMLRHDALGHRKFLNNTFCIRHPSLLVRPACLTDKKIHSIRIEIFHQTFDIDVGLGPNAVAGIESCFGIAGYLKIWFEVHFRM